MKRQRSGTLLWLLAAGAGWWAAGFNAEATEPEQQIEPKYSALMSAKAPWMPGSESLTKRTTNPPAPTSPKFDLRDLRQTDIEWLQTTGEKIGAAQGDGVVDFGGLGSGFIMWDADSKSHVVITTHSVALAFGKEGNINRRTSAQDSTAIQDEVSLRVRAPSLDLAVYTLDGWGHKKPNPASLTLCTPDEVDASKNFGFLIGFDKSGAQDISVGVIHMNVLDLYPHVLHETILYHMSDTKTQIVGAPLLLESGCVLAVHRAEQAPRLLQSQIMQLYRLPASNPALAASSLLPFSDPRRASLSARLEENPRSLLKPPADLAAVNDREALISDAYLFDDPLVVDLAHISIDTSPCHNPHLYELISEHQETYTADNGRSAYLMQVSVRSLLPRCEKELMRVVYHTGDATTQPLYIGDPHKDHHTVRFYVKDSFALRARLEFADRWRNKAALWVEITHPKQQPPANTP